MTRFGKYELLERLGAGGMAVVYRARYKAAPGITKPVVIKRVLGHYAEDQAFVEMFIHEARISIGLNHGNIVQVFDFGQVDGEYFLAMELVDGQPLSRVLKKASALGLSQLPPPLAVHIAIEMCKGLHHAHTRTDERGRPLGLVHRDISPDNVLISYEGEVKISDFGIAKAQLAGRPETESGVVKGKFRYFSPEQAVGRSDLDARSDVYAVGVVLYLMLCGRLPVEGNELKVMQGIAYGELLHPHALNPALDDKLVGILMDTLATQREARPQSAEALHLKLSQWAALHAPLFPVHALKSFLGLLYEPELAAAGRPPRVPPEFREQFSEWSRAAQARTKALAAQRPSERPLTARQPVSWEQQEPLTPPVEPAAPAGSTRLPLAVLLLVALGAVGIFLKGLVSAPALWVTSSPPGAEVRIDQKAYGTTPVEISGISRKEMHRVELLHPTSKPWFANFGPGMLGEELAVTLEAAPLPRPVEPGPRAAPVPAAPRLGTDKLPAHFVLQERWHSFGMARAFPQQLDPKRTYSVWVSGAYTGDAPISEVDLMINRRQPLQATFSRLYGFLEGEAVPGDQRFFMLSSERTQVTGARALNAFVLVVTTAERNTEEGLVLHVRDTASKKVTLLPINAQRHASQVALENRFTVRNLEPLSTYTLEIRPHEGSPSSAVALIVVPAPGAEVLFSGQPSEDFHHALAPGRYTVQGVRELWFLLPRTQHDGPEVQMEVSVDLSP